MTAFVGGLVAVLSVSLICACTIGVLALLRRIVGA
jgi:hypothetical protein